jgi:hypothetical protein
MGLCFRHLLYLAYPFVNIILEDKIRQTPSHVNRNPRLELPLHPKPELSCPAVSTASRAGRFGVVVRFVLAVQPSRSGSFARFVFIAPTMPRAWFHIADPPLPAIVDRRGQAKFDQRLFLGPRRTSYQFDRFLLQFGIVRLIDFTHAARIVALLLRSRYFFRACWSPHRAFTL